MASITPIKGTNFAIVDSERYDFTNNQSRMEYIDEKLEQIKDLRARVESVKEMAISGYNCDFRQDLVYQDLVENLNSNMISYKEIEAIHKGYLKGREQDSIMVRIYGKIARLQLMFSHIVKDMGKKVADDQLERSFKKLDHYENKESKKVFEYIKIDTAKIFDRTVFNSDFRFINRDLATSHLEELREYLTDVDQRISHYFTWYRGCIIIDSLFEESKNIEELDNQMAANWLADLKAGVKESFKSNVFSQAVVAIDDRLEDGLIETLINCLDDLKQALIDDIMQERKTIENEKKFKVSHLN